MNLRVVLVRHARAAPAAGADLLRPLTEDGLRQAAAQGRALAGLGLAGPVFASPARRCIETAQAIGDALGSGEIEITADLAESASDPEHDDAARRAGSLGGAILVGHQPGMESLACRMLGTSRLPVPLAPATALILSRDPSSRTWALERALSPP